MKITLWRQGESSEHQSIRNSEGVFISYIKKLNESRDLLLQERAWPTLPCRPSSTPSNQQLGMNQLVRVLLAIHPRGFGVAGWGLITTTIPKTQQDIALMRQNLNPFLVEDDDWDVGWQVQNIWVTLANSSFVGGTQMYKSSSFLVVQLLVRGSTCLWSLRLWIEMDPNQNQCLSWLFWNISGDMLSFFSGFTWSSQGLQWKPQSFQPFDGLRRMCAKPSEALERLPHQNAETGWNGSGNSLPHGSGSKTQSNARIPCRIDFLCENSQIRIYFCKKSQRVNSFDSEVQTVEADPWRLKVERPISEHIFKSSISSQIRLELQVIFGLHMLNAWNDQY